MPLLFVIHTPYPLARHVCERYTTVKPPLIVRWLLTFGAGYYREYLKIRHAGFDPGMGGHVARLTTWGFTNLGEK